MKKNCKEHLDMEICKSYPFCYGCHAWQGSTEELQQQIDYFFEDKPYKVTLQAPSLDEFETKLKDIIEECGGKFTNKNTKEVESFIKLQASLLRRIWREEEPVLTVDYHFGLQGLEKDLDEYFVNRFDATYKDLPWSIIDGMNKTYAQRITCKVLKDCYEEHCKDDDSQSSQ